MMEQFSVVYEIYLPTYKKDTGFQISSDKSTSKILLSDANYVSW